MFNKVVTVDYLDNPIDVVEKMSAHKKPLLHRAFSVILYNGSKILLQKRSENKYHSGGLIANTCCSHPQLSQSIIECAKVRLVDEVNIKIDTLHEIGHFVYFAKFNDNLFEYEYDHVLVGEYDGSFSKNEEEVSWIDWVEIEEVKKDIVENPQKYAVWFIHAFKIFLDFYNNL